MSKACNWCHRIQLNTPVLENGYHAYCFKRMTLFQEQPELKTLERHAYISKVRRLKNEWQQASKDSMKRILEKYGNT